MNRCFGFIKESYLSSEIDNDCIIPHTKIIDEKWNRHLCCNIQVATYFQNLVFLYDQSKFMVAPKVMQCLDDILEQNGICSNRKKVVKEIKIYRDQLESFSNKLASLSVKSIQPDLC